MARRVQAKGAGDRLGRGMPGRRQSSGSVDGEPGDAVVAAVADIEVSPRRCQMDLRAGVPSGEPARQARDRLHGGEGAGRSVQTIAGDGAALLIGEIDDILARMEAIVARTLAF